MNTIETAERAASAPEVAVDLRCARWSDLLPDVSGLCRRAAAMALEGAAISGDGAEISIVLADDAFVRELNRRWRDTDAATNVLAFPCADGDVAEGGGRLLGDVVVAFETTCREAEEENKRPDHHLAHLVVHGVLHLLGFDHDTDAAADRMEGLETLTLARLGIGDPYAGYAPGT